MPPKISPMPPLGTKLTCSMCRVAVVLDQSTSGWHYWVADGDPVDGGHHCYGGQPPAVGAVRTLHVPFHQAWRYSPDGDPRLP